MSTQIPYCDETLNATAGCTHSGMCGCDNCWAEDLHTKRHKAYLAGKDLPKQYAKPFKEIQLFPERIEQVLHWRKPRRIFWCSMSDMFHPDVPFEYIDQCRKIMGQTLHHTHLIFTKRIDRTLQFTRWLAGYDDISIAEWPRNVQLIISCSTQKDLDQMVPVLFQIPAAVRGVSLEPVLEDIDLGYTFSRAYKEGGGKPIFDHVIVGCEKLAGNRPGRFCEDEARWWQAARDIAHQCKAAGVAFYMKQGCIDGKVISEISKFPKDLQVREYPDRLNGGGKHGNGYDTIPNENEI